VGNDAAIFQLTAKALRKRGCIVNEYSETDLRCNEIKENFIFNMVRDWESVYKLQKYENEGKAVINSAYGIESCTREKMTRLLLQNDIPHPQSLIVRTADDPAPAFQGVAFHNCWIKRGDFHAIHREDVTYVRNREEAQSILEEFAARGIDVAVINEHLTGDLVKFYGVTGGSFFYWFYPADHNHSKFGLEQINGNAKGIPFDEARLHCLCNKAANVLNIHVYGGDCIVSDDDGITRIIDFNDWPSFAPCREEAAPHIAERIYSLISESCKKEQRILV
jgi:glutathione synthase/RimK-type ligase-like ATP-grasp enzyme